MQSLKKYGASWCKAQMDANDMQQIWKALKSAQGHYAAEENNM